MLFYAASGDFVFFAFFVVSFDCIKVGTIGFAHDDFRFSFLSVPVSGAGRLLCSETESSEQGDHSLSTGSVFFVMRASAHGSWMASGKTQNVMYT